MGAFCAVFTVMVLLTAGCANDADKFTTLETGMTYQEAVKVMGREGQKMPSGPPGGASTGTPANRNVYVWPGKEPGTQVSLIFEDGKLKEKYGVGLKAK
jgi:hypothetical protein